MRIENRLTSRVQPSHKTLGYLSDAGASPNAFGAQIGSALKELGSAFGSLAGELKDRDEKTKRYKLLNDVTQFQLDTSKELEERRRATAPGAEGFFKDTSSWYEKRESEFIKTHGDFPEDEVRYRLGGARTQTFTDSFKFQMAEGDRFFDQGVKDELENAKRSIEADPSQENLERWSATLGERVMSSGLPPDKKEEWKRSIPESLAAQAYVVRTRGKVKDDAGYYAWLGNRENSTGNPNAKNPDSSAQGIYQFTIGTWKRMMALYPELGLTLNGRGNPEQEDKAIRKFTELNAEVLRRNGIPETYGNLYSLHFLGESGGLKALKARDDQMMRDIASPAALKANPFLKGWSVARYKAWLLKRTGAVGSTVYRDQKEMDHDPTYNVIPAESFMKLRDDAVTLGTKAAAESEKIVKAQRDEEISNLRNDIERGKAGAAEIEAAYQRGLFENHAQYSATLDVLGKRKKEVDDLGNANRWFRDDRHVWANDKKHKDALNAYFADAPNKLAQLDQGYVTGEVVPAAKQTQLIPGVVEDNLVALSHDRDSQRMFFGLDSLSMLREGAPSAFAKLPEEVQRRVERYAALRDTLPADVLVERMRDGASATERKIRQDLRDEAEHTILKTPDAINKRITNLFDGVFSLEPSAPEYAPAARAMRYEYTELFKDNYSILGNEKQAYEATDAQIQRLWGVSELGGAKRVMKFAPHSMGYSETRDQFMDEQIRSEFKLGPDTQYALFGDNRTYTEYQQMGKGSRSALPSYTVAVNDPTKGWRVQVDELGRPLRYNFAMTKEFVAREAWEFDRAELDARQQRAERRLVDSRMEAIDDKRKAQLYGGDPNDIPSERPGLQQELDDIKHESYIHDVSNPSRKVPTPEQDGMQNGPTTDLREALLGYGEDNVPELGKNTKIFEVGNSYYVVPTFGEHPDEVQQHFLQSAEHLGKFETLDQAKTYIQKIGDSYRDLWLMDKPIKHTGAPNRKDVRYDEAYVGQNYRSDQNWLMRIIQGRQIDKNITWPSETGNFDTYGSPVSPFTEGVAGKANQIKFRGHNEFIDDIVADLAKNSRTSPRTLELYRYTAEVANRVPIAAVGFDPRFFGINYGNQLGTSSGGMLRGFYAPQDDVGVIVQDNTPDEAPQSTLVHESIHRGIQLLRNEGYLANLPNDILKTLLDDEENLVRVVMMTRAGDPEETLTKPEMRNKAKRSVAYQQAEKAVDALNEIAIAYITAHSRKMGPR